MRDAPGKTKNRLGQKMMGMLIGRSSYPKDLIGIDQFLTSLLYNCHSLTSGSLDPPAVERVVERLVSHFGMLSANTSIQ